MMSDFSSRAWCCYCKLQSQCVVFCHLVDQNTVHPSSGAKTAASSSWQCLCVQATPSFTVLTMSLRIKCCLDLWLLTQVRSAHVSERCFKVQREQKTNRPSPDESLSRSSHRAQTISDSLDGCFPRFEPCKECNADTSLCDLGRRRTALWLDCRHSLYSRQWYLRDTWGRQNGR